MRRIAGLSLAVILVLLVPTFAAADFFGLGLPWGSSWGQASSGCGSCCDPGLYGGAWRNCCSQFYVGYEIAQSRERKPISASMDLTQNPFGPYTAFIQQTNTHFSDPGGLWLGVSNYCQCSDWVGLWLSGWYLFPSSGDARTNYQTSFLTGPDPAQYARKWSTTQSWGWIDGAVVLGSPCGLNLIAGFRWDSFSIKLCNPGPVTPTTTFAIGTTSDEANLTLNSYIPLIGTQACWGGPCCGLLVRVWGFPWVPGNQQYGETGVLGAGTRLQANGNYDRASFVEVFCEYNRPCPGYGCLGFWARWNSLYTYTNSSPVVPGFGVINAGPIRSAWAIGGKVTLNFDLPRPL